MAVYCFCSGVGGLTEMDFEFNTRVNIFYKYSLNIHLAISLLVLTIVMDTTEIIFRQKLKIETLSELNWPVCNLFIFLFRPLEITLRKEGMSVL